MMRALVAFTYALVLGILIKDTNVLGADLCGSDKSAENQIVLNKDDYTAVKSPPSLSKKQHERMTCAWKVTAPAGYNVLFRILIAQFSKDCSNESVQIYNGAASSPDALLWEFCMSKPKTVRGSVALFSNSENAQIVLKTGNNPNSSYFAVRIEAVKKPVQPCSNNAVYNLAASSTVANFSSPYYSDVAGYPQNASCGWKITAPPGKLIKLQFKDSSVECSRDLLLVYDGEDEKQEDLVKKLCRYSTGRTDAIYSYGRSLFIKFKSSSYLRQNIYIGFLAYYSAVEGGTTCSTSNSGEVNSCLTPSTSSGNISSPGFPAVVPPVSIKCIWRLRAPEGQVIKLDLNTINLKFRISLDYSYPLELTVKSGTGPEMYKMQSFDSLENHMSRTLVSDGRRFVVEYEQTDKIKSGKRPIGFGAEYETLPLATSGSCSANQAGTINLNGEGASFHSLDYPGYHPANMNCRWNITVTAGQVIELHFDTSLDKDCSKEWVKVYDGPTTSSRMITKLCYYTYSYNKQALYSSTNRVLVEFISTTRSEGFSASYIAKMAAPKPYACSGKERKDLKGTSGKIASQGFPLSYANNVYCRWVITMPFQHIVKLTVTSLDLQEDPSCDKDTVRVIGEEVLGSSLIAKLCGKKNTPLTFKSTYNKVTVEFWSDGTGKYPGFEASFKAEPDPSFGNCTKQFVDNIIPISSTASGSISTPRHPNYYPPNMKCTWQIRVPKGQFIRLSFQEFSIGPCQSSYIEIRDGVDASSKLLHKLCDSRYSPLVVFSSGPGLWVHFKSGVERSTGPGFTAQYEAISQLPLSISCSEDVKIIKLEKSPGSIASYEYPLKYQNNVKCTWIIKTSSSDRFKIKFDFMDIEPSPGCKDDYVVIRDGGYSFSDFLGQFCGNTIPDTLTSSEDSIWIQFITNGTGKYPGFKLSYESTFNVRTIVLISVFSAVGIIGFLVVAIWIIKFCCCSGDVYADESNNMMELNKPKDDQL